MGLTEREKERRLRNLRVSTLLIVSIGTSDTKINASVCNEIARSCAIKRLVLISIRISYPMNACMQGLHVRT